MGFETSLELYGLGKCLLPTYKTVRPCDMNPSCSFEITHESAQLSFEQCDWTSICWHWIIGISFLDKDLQRTGQHTHSHLQALAAERHIQSLQVSLSISSLVPLLLWLASIRELTLNMTEPKHLDFTIFVQIQNTAAFYRKVIIGYI